MEENNSETNETQNTSEVPEKSGGMKWMFVVLAIVIVAFGAYYVMSNKLANTANQTMPGGEVEENAMEETVMEENFETGEEGTMVMEGGEVTVELAADGVQEVSVEGGMYYFNPNKITVQKGVPVKVTFTSVEGMHDFVIDGLDVKSSIVTEGKTTTVEFTADEAGDYEFYCSVADHKARGMVGTLVVE